MYGTQTSQNKNNGRKWFENDVKMYGTQTNRTVRVGFIWFENDVKMYGTQTNDLHSDLHCRLRMM